MSSLAPLTVEFYSLGLNKRQALISDVRAGLTQQPKQLPPRWFYDEHGSDLFEQITELPEYYQTRTEAEILRRCAGDIADRAQPNVILELGAGASIKTRMLIESALRTGSLKWFLPFDISHEIVQRAARDLLQEFPGLTVHAVIGDFSHHLDRIPRLGRQLIVFLGSTIGNFHPDERGQLLEAIRGLLGPEDSFLLGVDLVKDPAKLVAAYDDAQGVTAQFNLNVLSVINRELDANFDLTTFRHVARYDIDKQRIEMHLRSSCDQVVEIPGAEMHVSFREGELMMTEISAKFTQPQVSDFLGQAGLALTGWYTDDQQRFALALAAPTEQTPFASAKHTEHNGE